MVDNGSTDGSCDFVRQRYPWVRILEMGENAGFSRANNVAVRESQAAMLAFLNNDVEVHPAWLGRLVDAASKSPETTAWASKMLMFDHRELINGVGGAMNEVGYTFDLGMYERDIGQFDTPVEVLFPCAGACLIRREAFISAGGFDERFFMYHEDVDLGWSLWQLGGRVETVPAAVVYHKFGGTSKSTMGMARREYMGERNNIRSLIKHYEPRNLTRAIKLLLAQRQSPARKWQLLRNMAWNLRHLTETLALRKDIQRRRRRSDAHLRYLLYAGIKVPVCHPDYVLATRHSFESRRRLVYQVTMGENEPGCLSYGWYPLELNPAGDGRMVRWTHRDAALFLSGGGGQTRLHLRVYAMSQSTRTLAQGDIFINDIHAGRFRCAEEGWHEVTVKICSEEPVLEVRLSLDSTWNPSKVFKNDDPRALGIAIQCCWLD
jgi:GT2 family glycosyltransferase